MIRINLLGRARPKAARQAVPLEATLQIVFFALSLVVAGGILYYDWHSMTQQSAEVRSQIQRLNGEKARLEQLKAQVEGSEKQRVVLQQRINVIEELQRNRTGGQELAGRDGQYGVADRHAVADLVAAQGGRADAAGLGGIDRGRGQFHHATAAFRLFRSEVEIKDSQQDDKTTAVQMFNFTLDAQFALPQAMPTVQSPSDRTQRRQRCPRRQ